MVARFALRRSGNVAEERALLGQLGSALAGLPAPWSVIVNERPRQSPWVRYMVFHPDKGLALVDVASARPERKVGRVASLFTRAGFGAFEQGSLPLIAISIGKFQIEALEFCLDTAFQATRCGLTIADWPEQAIALLLERSDMNLKRLVRTNPGAQTPASEVAAPPIATAALEAAIEEPPPVRAAPPDPIQEPPVAIEEPDPVHAAPPEPVPEPPAFRAKERRPEPPPLRLQAEPRRDARTPYDRHRTKPRRRLRGTAAAVAAAAAVVVYVVMRLPAPHDMPPVATAPRPTPQVAVAPSAAPTQNNIAAPDNKAIEEAAIPPHTPADGQPTAKPDIPARTAVTPPPATPPVPTAAGTAVENLPPPTPSRAPLASPPQDTQPEKLAAIPPSPVQSSGAPLASPPQNSLPATTAAMPPPPPPPKPHIQHDTARAEGEASPKPDDELVMINGLTYVNGRQPHSLGTVKMPAGQADNWTTWYGGE